MNPLATRRRFIEILPIAGAAVLAACSPKPEPASPVSSPAEPVAVPPAPLPMPDATPTPTPAAPTVLVPVSEKDALAVALGYVEDASRADKTKFKTYAPGSQCSNCALYLGKVGDATGPCPLFTGKKVMAKGWCGSWVKRA
ncbi:MAG: high-potential iron-sulfur protein [Rhodoferax sp.]|uniref:high-potential iron-sulfur protein n=1 Tax=Rhodoferax sp. TaxID=50421 RepID=UPI0030171847